MLHVLPSLKRHLLTKIKFRERSDCEHLTASENKLGVVLLEHFLCEKVIIYSEAAIKEDFSTFLRISL